MSKNQNAPEKTESVTGPQPQAEIEVVDEVGGRVVINFNSDRPTVVYVFDNHQLWGEATIVDRMAIVNGKYPLTGDYSLTTMTVAIKPVDAN